MNFSSEKDTSLGTPVMHTAESNIVEAIILTTFRNKHEK